MKILISFLLLCITWTSQAQTQYLIQFKDKAASPFSINKPSEFLSERAIQRRQKQQISIDESDLPVNPRYIDSIRSAGNVFVLTKSKWLNQISIQTDDITAVQKITSFSFVKNSSTIKRVSLTVPVRRNKFNNEIKNVQQPGFVKGNSQLNYGISDQQIKIHNGDYLHDQSFSGSGMLIAIIDDGFYHYQSLPAFQKAINNHQIIETYDFVKLKTNVNEEDSHGMFCFSIIASNVDGEMIGSCPDASFLLYRSEDISSESPSEEQNWVAAAERSDSAGADLITTSLGYNRFDNPAFNYTYEDMDGETTIIARGAKIAASKGMILMIAAGNEGGNSWHYITTPGDAKNVLTVGAIDGSGNLAAFSSYGPTADGRIKPTVLSVGVGTALQSGDGSFASGNGTSFATPNLAGLVTCLWQAFPDFTSQEIMDAVVKSSSQFTNPDNSKGYGIPDFKKAFNDLLKERIERFARNLFQNKDVVIYPNPVVIVAHVVFRPKSTGQSEFRLYDMNGKLCLKKTVSFIEGQISIVDLYRNSLATGMYILQFTDGKKIYREKVMITSR